MKKLIFLIAILLLTSCAQAGEVDTVIWAHEGIDISGAAIPDMSVVRFKKHCGVVSGVYTVPPADLGAGAILTEGDFAGSYSGPIDINGPDGSYWCVLTAYDINNPTESESPYSTEYTVFKLGGKYYDSSTYAPAGRVRPVKLLP